MELSTRLAVSFQKGNLQHCKLSSGYLFTEKVLWLFHAIFQSLQYIIAWIFYAISSNLKKNK